MKISFFIGGLSGGGAERVVCNLANYLANDHSVSIYTMSDDEASYPLNERIVRKILLYGEERKGFFYNTVIRYLRLLNIIRKTKDDAFIIMLPETILMFLSLHWLTKAKVIASERNLPASYPKWQQKLLRIASNWADAWVFQTTEQKQWYDVGKKTMQTVIPNAVNINSKLGNDKCPAYRNKHIVNIGRLKPQKNQALLIRAFASVVKKHPDYTLSIYGEGPLLDNLKSLAIDLKVLDKVVFHGFVKDISAAICNAGMFVLSSDYEGMPNALLEAMALGVPCISTDCGGGGARAVIENGKNGILVPCNDEIALSNAICWLIENNEQADMIGDEAQKVSKNLSPSKIYSEWERFIINVVSNSN